MFEVYLDDRKTNGVEWNNEYINGFIKRVTPKNITMYYSITSDPSDGFSNHWSNFEGNENKTESPRRRLYRKRRIRLYEKFYLVH